MAKRGEGLAAYMAALSPEERKAHAAAAGKASGEARRRARTLQQSLSLLMRADVQDEGAAAALEQLGMDPSVLNALSLSVVARAIRTGDVDAARWVRDTLGEKPAVALGVELMAGVALHSLDLSQLSDAELEQLADAGSAGSDASSAGDVGSDASSAGDVGSDASSAGDVGSGASSAGDGEEDDEAAPNAVI